MHLSDALGEALLEELGICLLLFLINPLRFKKVKVVLCYSLSEKEFKPNDHYNLRNKEESMIQI